jgi:hypothetical protein
LLLRTRALSPLPYAELFLGPNGYRAVIHTEAGERHIPEAGLVRHGLLDLVSRGKVFDTLSLMPFVNREEIELHEMFAKLILPLLPEGVSCCYVSSRDGGDRLIEGRPFLSYICPRLAVYLLYWFIWGTHRDHGPNSHDIPPSEAKAERTADNRNALSSATSSLKATTDAAYERISASVFANASDSFEAGDQDRSKLHWYLSIDPRTLVVDPKDGVTALAVLCAGALAPGQLIRDYRACSSCGLHRITKDRLPHQARDCPYVRRYGNRIVLYPWSAENTRNEQSAQAFEHSGFARASSPRRLDDYVRPAHVEAPQLSQTQNVWMNIMAAEMLNAYEPVLAAARNVAQDFEMNLYGSNRAASSSSYRGVGSDQHGRGRPSHSYNPYPRSQSRPPGEQRGRPESRFRDYRG